MYCPHCGQERTSSETNFCSRCGFPLGGVAELLANGGVVANSKQPSGDSPRKKGLKQGLFIFLLTFLIVPIIAIISISIDIQPWAVAIAAILLSVGGILRMLYAWLFEEGVDQTAGASASGPAFLNRPAAQGALPPQQSIPVSAYTPPAGNWRDTKELEPGSVTDHTTKLLEKEEDQ